MRRALLALALGLAPAAGNAAALIEIPEQNGLKMVEIWDVSGDGRVLVGGCSLASGGGSACRWREGQGLEALETPSGADASRIRSSTRRTRPMTCRGGKRVSGASRSSIHR